LINILLTSKNSFLSKEISRCLPGCSFVYLDRENLLNFFDLKNIIKNNKIDHIVHSSWAGVGAGTFGDYVYNLSVHENLKNICDLVDKIFIFGSGSEFAETNLASEFDLPKTNLNSYYSRAKNKISWEARKINNFINLRLFGCFGKTENDHRFIKRSMLNIRNNKDVIINKDKEMDFFYAGDLISLIDYYIVNQSYNLPRDINCVYSKKYKLSGIAQFLVNKYSPQAKIKILEHGCADPYTGNSALLDTLNISFKGLHKGIEEIYS
jgi:dTDP-4-dehydrorhamnose reductase